MVVELGPSDATNHFVCGATSLHVTSPEWLDHHIESSRVCDVVGPGIPLLMMISGPACVLQEAYSTTETTLSNGTEGREVYRVACNRVKRPVAEADSGARFIASLIRFTI